MTFLLLGLYGGGAYYVIPEEGLRNNLLLHSGPIFSVICYQKFNGVSLVPLKKVLVFLASMVLGWGFPLYLRKCLRIIYFDVCFLSIAVLFYNVILLLIIKAHSTSQMEKLKESSRQGHEHVMPCNRAKFNGTLHLILLVDFLEVTYPRKGYTSYSRCFILLKDCVVVYQNWPPHQNAVTKLLEISRLRSSSNHWPNKSTS